MIATILLAVILFLGYASVSGRRSLFDGTDLPRLKDTDAIELYHLRSFSAMVIETEVGTFSTHTSGLALRSTTTDNVIVLQFKPKNYTTSFLPRFLSSTNSSIVTGLSWDKRAEIIYYDNIDTSFWQQSTFLARINGIVYKNYVKWLEEYIRHHAVFRPQSICSNEFDIDACFVLADTWDTFLADSFHLFAALSVRINAIIPPRASELKFISATEPIMVRMTNVSDQYADRYDRENRRRHPHDGENDQNEDEQDDNEDNDHNFNYNRKRLLRKHKDPKPISGNDNADNYSSENVGNSTSSMPFDNSIFNSTDNVSVSNQTQTQPSDNTHTPNSGEENTDNTNNNDINNTGSNTGSNNTISNDTSGGEEIPTTTVPTATPSFSPTTSPTMGPTAVAMFIDPNHPTIPTVHADAILRYYDRLLSCMQDYQESDFTMALKSCLAEDVAYIHIDGDLYWAITPRYPFVFLHDYLQEIPPPQFRSDPGVDAVDWSLVGFFIVTVCLGCLSTLYQIKIWELIFQAFRRCCACVFAYSSSELHPPHNISGLFELEMGSMATQTNATAAALAAEEHILNRRRQHFSSPTSSVSSSAHDSGYSNNGNNSTMNRLWGAFINYRGRNNQVPMVYNSAKQGYSSSPLSDSYRQEQQRHMDQEYAKLAQQDEEDEEEEGGEMEDSQRKNKVSSYNSGDINNGSPRVWQQQYHYHHQKVQADKIHADNTPR